jgi:hypothetical protein
MNTQEQAHWLHRDADGLYLGEGFEDAAPAPAGAAASLPQHPGAIGMNRCRAADVGIVSRAAGSGGARREVTAP